MDDDQQFCLRWNNHQSTLISVFDTLLENGTLVDCTLAAEGKFLKAHKVVLSACSPYFAALLSQQYDKHPIFILKDVKFQELRAMMDYMYRGEVNISQDQLAALLKAAESLQIKGLSDSRGSGGSCGSSQKADTSTKTHASVPAAKQTTAGLTIEQKRPRIEKHPATLDIEPDVSDSREGSTSPNSRKRKKVRRRSIETNNIGDNHDQHSNSSSHSMPHAASSTHSTSMPTITSATSSASVLNVTKKTDHQSHESKGDIERDVDDNGDDGADGGESHQQTLSRSKQQSASAGADADMVMAKDKMEHSTHSEMLLEPKNEYDESNEGNVEDLTLDDEELLDDLEQAGPSHGGEGSSQGYAQWQIERSQDEVFMGGQDSAGQHRDAQDPLFIDSDSSDSPNIYRRMTAFKQPMIYVPPPVKIRYDFAGPFEQLLTVKEFVALLKRKATTLYEKARLRINLENPDQNLLVRLIIEHLLDKDVEIELGKRSIMYLFTLIKHVFPNERMETYYVPSSKKKPTSGKLYKRFQNRRLELKKHGLIKRRDYDY